MPTCALYIPNAFSNKIIISSYALYSSYYFISDSNISGTIIIFYAAIEAYLNSEASTQAKHNSFHVLDVLAFYAASIALLNYFNLTRHDAILALFLSAVNNIFAASYNY